MELNHLPGLRNSLRNTLDLVKHRLCEFTDLVSGFMFRIRRSVCRLNQKHLISNLDIASFLFDEITLIVLDKSHVLLLQTQNAVSEAEINCNGAAKIASMVVHKDDFIEGINLSCLVKGEKNVIGSNLLNKNFIKHTSGRVLTIHKLAMTKTAGISHSNRATISDTLYRFFQ